MSTVGLIAYNNARNEEEQIEREQVTVAEHEVIEVKEAIPEVYMPIEMFEKNMFNGRFSREEVCLTAALTYCEVGGSSVEAMIDACSVIFNRMDDPDYPDTIEGVVYQAGQYEPALKGTIEKYIDIYYYGNVEGLTDEELEDLEKNFEANLLVYENGSQLPKNVIYQAPFVQGGGDYIVIDGEHFCIKE